MLRICKKTGCWILFFFLTVPGSLCAQGENPQDSVKSARTFVQEFYNWYLKHGMDKTLKYKKALFSPKLFQLLKEDVAAQAKARGEIVGVTGDFDVFLASQDPGERYVVGKATPKGESFLVEVYGIWSGKKGTKPAVVPEVAYKDGHWFFVNFHYEKTEYQSDENLLNLLKLSRRERQKQRK